MYSYEYTHQCACLRQVVRGVLEGKGLGSSDQMLTFAANSRNRASAGAIFIITVTGGVDNDKSADHSSGTILVRRHIRGLW